MQWPHMNHRCRDDDIPQLANPRGMTVYNLNSLDTSILLRQTAMKLPSTALLLTTVMHGELTPQCVGAKQQRREARVAAAVRVEWAQGPAGSSGAAVPVQR